MPSTGLRRSMAASLLDPSSLSPSHPPYHLLSMRSKCCKYKCKHPPSYNAKFLTSCPLSPPFLSLFPLLPSFFLSPLLSITSFQTSEPDRCSLTVTHFHYTAWPDHRVRHNAMSLITFICCVRKLHPPSSEQPLLVHCSAVVGQTGTFILLDAMMQQMRSEGSLSVYQFLRNMRGQRMKMVQTQVCQTLRPTQSMH